MRNNRSALFTSRASQGLRKTGKLSVLANQKIGRRPRPAPMAGAEGNNAVPWRTIWRRSHVPWAQRVVLRLLHNGFWLLAAVGLSIKWCVELFTGDDAMRQNREEVAMEPSLEDESWQEHEENPRAETLIEPWSGETPVTVAGDLRDAESLKMASLEEEEKELSEEELTDQAASLRARLERVKHES